MLASIILVSCTMASLQSCATATDTDDTSFASDAAPSNYTTMTSTSTSTYSKKHSTTDSMMPPSSGTLAATPTSTSTYLSTTLSTTTETMLATQSLVFAGDYATVVGSAKTRFLDECTAALTGAACIDVHAGSIIVTLQGLPSALTIALTQLQASGVDLPSFASLSLEMTENGFVLKATSTNTTGITTANATSSQSDAPADDRFVMPVVIIAGSLSGLCLSLASCYGLFVFRRRGGKQSKETPQPLDSSQDLDCVILKVEESPRASPQDSKAASSGDMSHRDLDSINLHVDESPIESSDKLKEMPSGVASMKRGFEESHQESHLELKEMPSREDTSRDMPSSPAAGRDLPTTPVDGDEWKLIASDDAPEALPVRCQISVGRTSL